VLSRALRYCHGPEQLGEFPIEVGLYVPCTLAVSFVDPHRTLRPRMVRSDPSRRSFHGSASSRLGSRQQHRSSRSRVVGHPQTLSAESPQKPFSHASLRASQAPSAESYLAALAIVPSLRSAPSGHVAPRVPVPGALNRIMPN
jgi:hypothetical protein